MAGKSAGEELRAKFRAEQRALRAKFDACLAGGKHTYEKGLRHEQVLIEFLREHLPPRYGVSRGEVADSKGHVARQADVVVYDAHHAPLLQRSEGSQVFAAESVFAVIEVKPKLSRPTLADAVGAVATAKALDRSAIVASHHGHRLIGGPSVNPPMFGAIFALDGPGLDATVPALADLHGTMRWQHWTDAVCVLDKGLVYHFARQADAEGKEVWHPTVLTSDSRLGYYESGEDTLLYFYLFLLYQLSAKELFPPDLVRYAMGLEGPPGRIYLGDRQPCPNLRRRRPGGGGAGS
ncbi:MAG: hypothetical protein FJ290_01035 [Planctomycetes bacterium]|nr:hypothetical protein [Planctomycetota bacterium]